jgi:hypothetical protein
MKRGVQLKILQERFSRDALGLGRGRAMLLRMLGRKTPLIRLGGSRNRGEALEGFVGVWLLSQIVQDKISERGLYFMRCRAAPSILMPSARFRATIPTVNARKNCSMYV